ncbi:MAG: hypothetical protein JWQ22_2633 [Devosia sp.]|nr:hypothetical protein [Devosia sp.]
MQGDWVRLSWPARNGRAAARGRKSRPGVAGIRARLSAASSAFGQTSHIEDAGGGARRRSHRNADRRPFIGITVQSHPRPGTIPTRPPRHATSGARHSDNENETLLPSPCQSMNRAAVEMQTGRTRRHRHAESSLSRSNKPCPIEIGVLRSVLSTPNRPLQPAVGDSREQGGPTAVAEKVVTPIDGKACTIMLPPQPWSPAAASHGDKSRPVAHARRPRR